MRRPSLLPALLLPMLLSSACVTTRHVWRKDGVTDDQARREHATCLYNAEVLCGTQYHFTADEAANRNGRFQWLYKQCMQAAGYQEHVIEE